MYYFLTISLYLCATIIRNGLKYYSIYVQMILVNETFHVAFQSSFSEDIIPVIILSVSVKLSELPLNPLYLV